MKYSVNFRDLINRLRYVRAFPCLVAVIATLAGHAPSAAVAGTEMTWIEATSQALWSARGLSLGLVKDNSIWVMGGCHGAGPFIPNNEVWSSPDGHNWTRVASSAGWTPRFHHMGAVFNNNFWVMGGVTSSTYVSDVWYSANGASWTKATNSAAWGNRGGGRCLVFNGEMWVLGGVQLGVGQMSDVWHSTNGTQWTRATDSAPWGPRSVFGALVYGGQMWVLGGAYLESPPTPRPSNDVWSSSNGVNWTRVTAAAPWQARFGLTVAVLQDKMWVLSGSTDILGTTMLNDCWYSSDGLNWTQANAAAPWAARGNAVAVACRDALWIMGGARSFSADQYCNDVWRTEFSPLPRTGVKVWRQY